MSIGRMRRVLVSLIALLALSVALMIAGMALTSVAEATPQSGVLGTGITIQTSDAIIEFGDPVYVAENEHAGSVVSFGGDVTIAGTVTDAVVAFGGDVRILSTANVGGALSSADPSVVAMGGTITVADGARVTGELQRFGEDDWSGLANASIDTRVWSGFSFFGWLVQTALFLVLGLVAAALMPKQMLAVGRALSRRPGASLGWGALTFFIMVPAAALVLLISIIGILLLVPAAVALPLFYFFVAVSVAAFIVQMLIPGKGRTSNLMVATTLGIVGMSIVIQVPVVGGLALLVVTLWGTGAAILAVVEWRRARKTTPAPQPAGGPFGAAHAGAAGQATWTATAGEVTTTAAAGQVTATAGVEVLAEESVQPGMPAVQATAVAAQTADETRADLRETVSESTAGAQESLSGSAASAEVPEVPWGPKAGSEGETPAVSRRRLRRRLPEAPGEVSSGDQAPSASES